MDRLDFKILNLMQEGIPISENPFHKMAGELGITPDELMGRLENIKKSGYIRRIGAIFDSSKLGYESVLVGAKVSENKISSIADIINSYNEVTHNYYRDNGRKNSINIWFTITTKDSGERKRILEEISSRSGVYLYEFPKVQLFKLKVFFNMEGV